MKDNDSLIFQNHVETTHSPTLVELKREEPALTASSAESDRFGDHDLPKFDIEQTYLFEEIALSMLANDIIKKSNQIFRLHYYRNEPEPSPDLPAKKDRLRMPSSIDSLELEGQIARKLAEERVYLNEELSLATLAHELEVEPHQLSRFLNIQLHTTFTALINSYRVNEAKALLINAPEDTILNIAFAAGFNSKASFNRIFKKVTGMTPSEYRLRMRGNNVRCPIT
jgi:AraC-like DNA-binding protein